MVKTGASLYIAGSTALLGAIVGEIAGIVLLLLFVRKKTTPVVQGRKKLSGLKLVRLSKI